MHAEYVFTIIIVYNTGYHINEIIEKMDKILVIASVIHYVGVCGWSNDVLYNSYTGNDDINKWYIDN